jgi:hypothetical protein
MCLGRVLAFLGAAAAGQGDEKAALLRRLQDPAQVFPYFQELVRAGELGKARELLSPAAKRLLPHEQLVIAFSAFDAVRRLVASCRVHGAGDGRARLCSAEFGLSREVRLARFGSGDLWFWSLDLTNDDLDAFKSRALGWHRHQVRRADGWHYAYPPDWTYAPLGRACNCGREPR